MGDNRIGMDWSAEMKAMNRSIRRGAASRCGSIVCEEWNGNLRIHKSHTPSEAIVIERADIDDLMVALDGILGQREEQPSKSGDRS